MGWRALAVLVDEVQVKGQKREERNVKDGKEVVKNTNGKSKRGKKTVSGRNGATRWDGQRDEGPGKSNNSRPEVSDRERRRQTQGWMARGRSAVTKRGQTRRRGEARSEQPKERESMCQTARNSI